MIEKPRDRVAAAKALVEAIGGGCGRELWRYNPSRTHELFAGEAQGEIMRAAKTALAAPKPPTA